MMLNKITKIICSKLSTTKRMYDILGISINATSQQIKTAYYQKAKQHHPDLNPGVSGSRFNQIRKAYDQLMKNSSQDTFNQYKQKEFKSTGSQKQQNKNEQYSEQQQNYRHQNKNKGYKNSNKNGSYKIHLDQQQFIELQKAFNSFLRFGYLKNKYVKYNDFFNQMFGSNQNYQNQNNKNRKKNKKKRQDSYEDLNDQLQSDDEMFYEQDFYEQNQYNNSKQHKKTKQNQKANVKTKHRLKKLDISYNMQIKQSQLGNTIRIKFARETICPTCSNFNNNSFGKSTCKVCSNKTTNSQQICQKCKGKGFNNNKNNCRTCGNKHFIRKIVQQAIIIPLGIQDGCKVIFDGRGHQSRRNNKYGDLVINVNITNIKQNNKNKQNTNEQHRKQTNSSNSNKNNNNSYRTTNNNSKHNNESYKPKQLQRQVNISSTQAVLGCMVFLKSNNGVSEIKIPAGVQHGDIIKNKSSQKQPKRIKIGFTIPYQISQQQRIIYQKLRTINSKNSQT